MNIIKNKKFDFKRKLKLHKKTIGVVAILAIATSVTSCSINNYIEKKQLEYNENTYEFIMAENDESDLEFYDKLQNYSEEADQMLEYIKISEKLNDLKLDEYSVSFFNYKTELYKPNDILLLIDKYETLKDEVDDNIGNDVIELNEVVYVLKQQEKLTNQKLYESYDVLYNYSSYLTKALLADINNIEDPSAISISYHYEKADNSLFGYFTVDNITYHLYDDNKISRKILCLAKCSTEMENQNETDIDKIQAYNSDRNKLLMETYKSINKLTSQIIELAQEENQKGNQKGN